MKSISALLMIAAAFLSACQQRGTSGPEVSVASTDTNPDNAIRSAIRAHLAHNANLDSNAFDTQVKRVTFQGDRAQAEVEFHVKNGSGVMQLMYSLAKQNGAWSVTESTPMGSNFSHPETNQAQISSRNTTKNADSSIFRTMDNFHRGAVPPTQELPPDHPRINATPTRTPQSTDPQ